MKSFRVPSSLESCQVGCLITLFLYAAFLPVLSAADKQPAPRRYRVIFNCDGHAVAKDAKGDLNQWLENLFGPLEKSHVEVLFWCDGAGGNTANYDSKVLERTGVRSGQPRTYIDKWIDEGNDPPRVVVREARKRGLDVFYSFRINDIHDSFIPDEMPTFKVKNPRWMIGEQDYGGVKSFKTALNFAVPEVREMKFRVIEELFQKYDFDGL
ncbi:MAG: family 10 glycosylhydrolase, partial [Pirellulaceae bacterium]